MVLRVDLSAVSHWWFLQRQVSESVVKNDSLAPSNISLIFWYAAHVHTLCAPLAAARMQFLACTAANFETLFPVQNDMA